AATITSTATTPTIMKRFPGFFSSAATESKVPKFAWCAGSARLSSFFGGTAKGTTSMAGAVLIGSTLDTAGAGAAAARTTAGAGLITTGGGAIGAGAATAARAAATGAD